MATMTKTTKTTMVMTMTATTTAMVVMITILYDADAASTIMTAKHAHARLCVSAYNYLYAHQCMFLRLFFETVCIRECLPACLSVCTNAMSMSMSVCVVSVAVHVCLQAVQSYLLTCTVGMLKQQSGPLRHCQTELPSIFLTHVAAVVHVACGGRGSQRTL